MELPGAACGARVAVAVRPGRLRPALCPQAHAVGTRLALQWRQMRVVLGIGRIDPGQAGAHLCGGDIGVAAAHIGHGAAIGVLVQRRNVGVLLQAQLRQVLPGALPIGLAAFGCINGRNAHPDRVVSARWAAAGGEGVAVADGDDQAKQGGGRHNAETQKSG